MALGRKGGERASKEGERQIEENQWQGEVRQQTKKAPHPNVVLLSLVAGDMDVDEAAPMRPQEGKDLMKTESPSTNDLTRDPSLTDRCQLGLHKRTSYHPRHPSPWVTHSDKCTLYHSRGSLDNCKWASDRAGKAWLGLARRPQESEVGIRKEERKIKEEKGEETSYKGPQESSILLGDDKE